MASSSDSFRSLNEKFNDLMSSYGCKDGVLTILEEMLEMLNREDDIINVESIIDIPLLLTNLHAALNNFEQFRVIYAPDELDFEPDSETALPHFCFIPAEGETSLQRYTKEGETHQHDPFDTFGDIQKYIWPEINAIQESDEDGAAQKLVFTLGTYPTGIQTFSIFTVEEFEAILCGEGQNSWSLEELREHINITDGYTAESVPIVNLLEILQGFDREQRRGFLQFVTGTPRLPSGGLASLNPKLRVVKIYDEKCLPSAATCYNQLTLPPYPSKDTMKEKLLYVITEGQESFDYI